VDVDTAVAEAAQARAEVANCTARYETAVVTAYTAGASLRRLAQACDLTVEGVRQVLLRRGVELRPPHVR
jgi:hypothetical protein